jgi:hypothetical protein
MLGNNWVWAALHYTMCLIIKIILIILLRLESIFVVWLISESCELSLDLEYFFSICIRNYFKNNLVIEYKDQQYT